MHGGVARSIPERDVATGKLYNSCLVVGPDGDIICKHRKVHLFLNGVLTTP